MTSSNIDQIWARYQQYTQLFSKYKKSVSDPPSEELSAEIEELEKTPPQLDRTILSRVHSNLKDVEVRDLGYDAWCFHCGGEVWFRVGDLYCFKCFEDLFLKVAEDMGCELNVESRSKAAWFNPMYGERKERLRVYTELSEKMRVAEEERE